MAGHDSMTQELLRLVEDSQEGGATERNAQKRSFSEFPIQGDHIVPQCGRKQSSIYSRWQRLRQRITPTWSLKDIQKAHAMGLAPKKHPFATIISIAILNPRGEVEVCLHACAIFDTGCPSNLMSTEFADRAAHNLKKKYGEGSLIGLGGGTFNSIGVVEGRFHIGENKFTTMGGRLVDDPKMYAASFEVSDRTQRFDVIIGSKTISQYQLLVWNPPAAYPVAKSFRSAHATQDTHNAASQATIEKAKAAREQNQRDKDAQSDRQTQDTPHGP